MGQGRFRRLARGVFAVILGMAAANGAHSEDFALAGQYRLLEIGGVGVRWAAADGTVRVNWAFVDRHTTREGARNCKVMEPLAARLPAAADLAGFEDDVRHALASWEDGTAIRFVEVADPAMADLLIGAQAVQRGIAFADVRTEPGAPGIEGAAICFNPGLAWEVATHDGDPATPNVRYVAAHEAGHVLGLDHVAGGDAIMDFHNREHVLAPQPADLRGIAALYPAARMAAVTE